MNDINELRNFDKTAHYGHLPLEVSGSEMLKLLDRLEAAEKERDDVAQQLVQSEIGKRDISEAHDAVTRRLSALADENTVLRAKIEEMERQEPVGEIVAFGESLHEVSWIKGKLPPLGAKLYTLPGAKEKNP